MIINPSTIHAKNNNVYFELYSTADSVPFGVFSAECMNINDLIDLLKKYKNICFVGDGSTAHKELLTQNLPTSTFSSYNDISSYSLGIAGLNAYNSGRREELLPVYLRKSQAERAKESN